jgi:hypothetical protein
MGEMDAESLKSVYRDKIQEIVDITRSYAIEGGFSGSRAISYILGKIADMLPKAVEDLGVRGVVGLLNEGILYNNELDQ